MAQNPFGRLIQVNSQSKWESKKVKGNLAFGHWQEGEEGSKVDVYKIWANEIEYNIADASKFQELYDYVHTDVDSSIVNVSTFAHLIDASVADLSTHVYTVVDPSINNLEASVADISTWKNDLELGVANNTISINGIDGAVTVLGSDYVAISTTDSSKLQVSIDGSVAKSKKHTTDDDDMLATVGLIQDAADNLLEDVSIYAAYDAKDASREGGKITIEIVKGDNTSIKQQIPLEPSTNTSKYLHIKNDKTYYTNECQTGIIFTLNTTNSSDDIANASNGTFKLTDAYAVKEYVASQIGTLASALELKGEIISDEDAIAKLTTAATSKGDVYVVSAACEYDGKTLEQGDMVIIKANSDAGSKSDIIVVERNLDGAVTAAKELGANKVVLGSGAQGVQTSDYEIGSAEADQIGDSSLATEKFVDNLVKVSGGTLSAVEGTANESAKVKLTAKDGTTALGEVTIKSLDTDYLKVNGADDSIGLDLAIADVRGYVKDASDNGLALAEDVSLAIKDAIESLDVTDTAVSGQVVVAVSEENGIITPERLGVKVNGQALATVEEGEGESKVNVLSVTIDGDDILVGGEDASTYAKKSIATAIDEIAKTVAAGVDGEDPLEAKDGTTVDGQYLAVQVIKNEGETPKLDSSIRLANVVDTTDITNYTAATATGLATDAYVKDYVAYELAWEVIE